MTLTMLEHMFHNKTPLSEADVVTEAHRIIYRARHPLSASAEGIPLWTTCLYQRGMSSGTIYAYRRNVQRLLEYDPTPDVFSIEAHISILRSKGLQVNTLIQHIKSIKSFFDFLDQHRLWSSNPASHIVYPKLQRKERAVPSLPVIRSVLHQSRTLKDRLILSLFLDTGLRLSELASLRLDLINLAERELIVSGKGGKERRVPFSASVGKFLYQYISQKTPYRAGEGSKWLFPARRRDSSQGHVVVASFQRRIAALCNQAGVGHLTPHQLRHFFATYELSHGADVKAVSNMLGHASVATTLDIYHHVDQKAIKCEHDKHSPLRALQNRAKEGVNGLY